MNTPNPTAAILIIGNEILSGRTQDKNIQYLAQNLATLGIKLSEVRVVPDIEHEIIDAVNALRAKYGVVFTTGGIGPTHDDITCASIAKAFGVKLVENAEALSILQYYYQKRHEDVTEARRRMAQCPEGAALVPNPVSGAPGFHLGNVYIFAGVPGIMQGMFDSIKHELKGGDPIVSISITGDIPESKIAQPLGALQAQHPDVDMGSYPYVSNTTLMTSIVLRGTDIALLRALSHDVRQMMQHAGANSIEVEG